MKHVFKKSKNVKNKDTTESGNHFTNVSFGKVKFKNELQTQDFHINKENILLKQYTFVFKIQRRLKTLRR